MWFETIVLSIKSLLNIMQLARMGLFLFTNSLNVAKLAQVQTISKCNCLELSSFLANKREYASKYCL